MSPCKPCPTPMVTSPKLSKTDGLPFPDPTLYRSTIGALQYLTLTRPDIAFSVNKLSQFLSQPADVHWSACKRVLRYLKGTSKLALQFNPSSHLHFVGFSDADYASCPDDRRSTVCFLVVIFFFGDQRNNPLFLGVVQSPNTALLQTSLPSSFGFNPYVKNLGLLFVTHIRLGVTIQVLLHYQPIQSSIEVDVHFVREKVMDKVIEVGHVPTTDQIADVFTKPLPEHRFCLLRDKLQLVQPG